MFKWQLQIQKQMNETQLWASQIQNHQITLRCVMFFCSPRSPQEAPKRPPGAPQEAPKRCPRAPKRPLKQSRELRYAQYAPRRPPETSNRPSRSPKRPLRGCCNPTSLMLEYHSASLNLPLQHCNQRLANPKTQSWGSGPAECAERLN